MNEKQLRRAIEQLLESQPDNQRLRDNLEGLSRDPLLPALTWYWGPRLYARSKAIFRPFILNHFSQWTTANERWARVHWAEHASDLEAWLQAARTSRDSGLIRRLHRWKYAVAKGWGLDQARWNAALADAYRAIASGVSADPYVVDRVTDVSGQGLYDAPRAARAIRSAGLRQIQEGLRGVVRIPGGTANALNRRDFPVPVLGKTGTTSDFRDALFVGSTYGTSGITVAVRIGFDDNRPLGRSETGGRAALPIFREIMLRVYADQLVGPVPRFPGSIEAGIDRYVAMRAEPKADGPPVNTPFKGYQDQP